MKNYVVIAVVFVFVTSMNLAKNAKISNLSFESIDIVIGSGTNYDNKPFITMWEDAKTDIIYTSEEIINAGGITGSITRIGFNFQLVQIGMNDFNIKMAHSNLQNLSLGLVNVEWVTVYYSSFFTPSGPGWQYIDLQFPFEYNGIDNLLIELCFDNNSTSGTGSNVYVTFTSEITMYSVFEDNSSGCSLFNKPGEGFAKYFHPNLGLTIVPTLKWNFLGFDGKSIETILIDREETVYLGLDAIYRSTDNGLNWQNVFSAPINQRIWTLGGVADTVFAGTGNGNIFKSTNFGTTWSESSNGLSNFGIQCFISSHGQYLIGTENGGIYKTTNFGAEWYPTNQGLSDLNIISFAVNADGIIFAGTLNNGLFKSVDDGESWSQVISTPSIRSVNAISMSENGIVYIGTQYGIYKSDDDGSNWTPLHSGYQYSSICIVNDEELYVGTFTSLTKIFISFPRMS